MYFTIGKGFKISRNYKSKNCASCGRAFSWRKRFIKCWDEVKYCSRACRAEKLQIKDRGLDFSLKKRLEKGTTSDFDLSKIAKDHFGCEKMTERVKRAFRRIVNQQESPQD